MADEQKVVHDPSSTFMLLNSEIGKLTALLNASNEKQLEKLTDISNRLIRLEMQYQAVERIDKEFKDHVASMGPIRDEVIVAKRMGRMAAWASGLVPLIISGLMSIWHPWNEDTRQQIAPVVARIDSLSDKVTTQQFTLNNIQDAIDRLNGRQPIQRMPDPRGTVNR